MIVHSFLKKTYIVLLSVVCAEMHGMRSRDGNILICLSGSMNREW